MTNRAIYLAVSDRSSRQRGHFAIFIPNEPVSSAAASPVTGDEALRKAKGTIIQVVGEPLMQGYKLEFKRNCDCETLYPVQKLVPLGCVGGEDVAATLVGSSAGDEFYADDTPGSKLERVAAQVQPPRRGQDVRAPIDGVATRRCQEWTTEFIRRLEDQGLIGPGAVEKVQGERDPPTHGIFGYGGEDENH